MTDHMSKSILKTQKIIAVLTLLKKSHDPCDQEAYWTIQGLLEDADALHEHLAELESEVGRLEQGIREVACG